MVKPLKSRSEEEEEDNEDFVSRTPDGSSQKVKIVEKNGGQKASALRSKHSETEQRRRSKINERFQILRDLIPQNDQKRDKASFLLEVIQYIHYLQGRLQMYEGTYQGWSPEPAKLMPWRNNCGSIDSFIDQPHLIKNGSGHEDNIVSTPAALLVNTNVAEPDFSEPAAYEKTDNSPVPATQPNSFTVPLQPHLFESVPTEHPQDSVSDGEHLASQSQSHFWQDRPCTTECVIPRHSLDEQEGLKAETGEASISNVYSQELLNTLSHALQSSGVDLSQASISVQLVLGKSQVPGLTATMLSRKDHASLSPGYQATGHYGIGSSGDEPDQAYKRIRTEPS